MRILYFLLLIIIFTSCDQPKKPYIEELTWPKRTVKLDNNLGVLTIRLPKEFDTFYQFKDMGDHSCGDYKKYRFQKSSFPKLMESGMFQNLADSVFYFTIIHNQKSRCDGIYSLDTANLHILKNKIFELSKPRKVQVKISSKEKINQRNFLIIACENEADIHLVKDNQKHKTAVLRSFTYVNDQFVVLNFNCAASNCDSFIPKMYKALKTVQIKPN